jgi:hypothetical protein
MNAMNDLIEGMRPLTAEELAGMSPKALAIEYFHGLECDPEMELDETKLAIAEIEKRGLSTTDMHSILVREIEATRVSNEGWPTTEEELRGFDDAQLAEAYFEEADLAKDSAAMGLIKAEIIRRAGSLEEFWEKR